MKTRTIVHEDSSCDLGQMQDIVMEVQEEAKFQAHLSAPSMSFQKKEQAWKSQDQCHKGDVHTFRLSKTVRSSY